jgi:hypothetical protein
MKVATAEARKTVDLLQRMVEVELFTADRADRAALLEEHAELRRVDDDIARREEREAEVRHQRWLAECREEFRLCQRLGTRPFIQRRFLGARQKATLLKLLGPVGYGFLPW